jgi:hypothetical protein
MALMQHRLFFLVLPFIVLTAAHAEEPVQTPDAPGTEQKIEHIQHEDKSARIDELRVGGETRSITVTPKNGAPAYEVTPSGNNRNPSDEGAGKARWNIFNY